MSLNVATAVSDLGNPADAGFYGATFSTMLLQNLAAVLYSTRRPASDRFQGVFHASPMDMVARRRNTGFSTHDWSH
jgi:hypothetical protein